MEVAWRDLEKGQLVWMTYGDRKALGPLQVIDFFNDHQGRHVRLADQNGEVMNTLLADDDDFGALCFYDKPT